MERYKNLSGDSGVSGYRIDNSSIEVQFRNGSTYLYTDQVTGQGNVRCMKELALSGSGLNSFINRAVRKMYAKKIS